MNKAVFWDRDGTINVDVGYLSKIEDIELFSFVIESFSILKKNNFLNFIITNQSAIARGYFTEEHLKKINEEYFRIFNESEKLLDDIFYSPFHIDGIVPEYTKHSDTRKPGIGMIKMAVEKYNIDLSKSFLIGDSIVDMQCAENAGIKKILVLTGYGEKTRKECEDLKINIDFISGNLKDITNFIVTKK